MEQQTKSRSKSSAATLHGSKSKSSNNGSSKATNGTNGSNGHQRMDTQLEKFFVDELKDIYYAEKLLTKALPKMAKSSTTEELKHAFEDHLAVTQEQIVRLEQIFDMLGKKAQAKKCEAMEGLKKEADSIVEDTEKGSLTRDVGLIFAAQKVEHYEIATYGSLRTIASTVGMNDIADLLQQTLDEEKEADEMLTSIAENNINYQAASEDEDDMG